MRGIVNMVFGEVSNTGNCNFYKNLLERELYKLFVSQCKNIKKLYWETSQPLPLFLGASRCFSQLHFLSINVELHSNTLHEMAKICKDLRILSIDNCSQRSTTGSETDY